MTETRSELYLVIEAGGGDTERLGPVLARLRPASVLIAPRTGEALDAASAGPLVKAVQAAGVAAVLLDDARLARTLKADGVHLVWTRDVTDRYRDAREMLGARFIVGADAGKSRHDAMTLGEAGADYIGFGVPPGVSDLEGARARRADLVQWWSEIFEVPCVAFDVGTAAEAAELTRFGADFIGVRITAGQTIAAEQDRLAEIAGAIAGMAAGTGAPAGVA
jgi:thiamine-phosphate pyrophosphorylase